MKREESSKNRARGISSTETHHDPQPLENNDDSAGVKPIEDPQPNVNHPGTSGDDIEDPAPN